MNMNRRAGGKSFATSEQRAAYHKKMTETPIPRLVGRLAIPSIATLLISNIYNTADTFFISKIGTNATAAVTICFTLMVIIQAAGNTLGMGVSNMVATLLGCQKDKEANEAASTGFFAAVAIGISIAVLGFVYRPQLMMLIGTPDTLMSDATTYAKYILLAAPLMGATIVMDCILRGEGKSYLGMIGMLTGGFLNVVLDPVLIFYFNMGVAGAAIATAISQTFSFCILLYMFLHRKSNVWIGITHVRGCGVLWGIVKLGSPTMCRQGLHSISTIVVNHAAGIYGASVIAAIGIVNRISSMMNNVAIGMNQGYQPVCGYNYGARNYRRVYDATRFIAIFVMALKSCIGLVLFIFAPQIMALFTPDDMKVIEFGTLSLRLCCLTAPLMGMYTTASTCYQSTGRSLLAFILAFLRQGAVYIPLMLIVPPIWGEMGIQMCRPLADVIGLGFSLPFYLRFQREILRMEREQKLEVQSSK